MTALQIYETIIASGRHQLATTVEGQALTAIAGDDVDKLLRLIARNAAQAIECELLFETDEDDFMAEAPTQPVRIGAEAAPGIIVVERQVA